MSQSAETLISTTFSPPVSSVVERAPGHGAMAPILHPAAALATQQARMALKEQEVVLGFWDSCPLDERDRPGGMVRRGMTTDQWREKQKEMSIYGPVAEVGLMIMLTIFGVMVERVVVFFFSTNDLQF
ncbi:MAG: hypothetical protein IT229_13660 [Flavobacteriales bacterium]|nr:hypothetical protein [Flavobacteriales bacterium]